MIKTFTLLAASFASGSVLAADMAIKAPSAIREVPPMWSGPYFGIRGGYGSGDADYLNLGGSQTGATFSGVTVPFSNAFGALGQRATHGADGGVLGYVTGINWQTGNIVYGLEHTLSWTSIDGSTGTLQFPVPPATFVPQGSFSSKLKWYGTAETRLGLVFGNSLLYVKGGIAAGQLEVSGVRTNGASNGDHFSQKDYRAGWTVGGGWDYMFARNWVFGIEGSYVDLGKENVAGQMVDVNGVGGAGAFNEEVKFTFWTVTGRLTYRWGN